MLGFCSRSAEVLETLVVKVALCPSTAQRSFHPQPTDSAADQVVGVYAPMRALGSAAWGLRIGQDAFVGTCDRLSLCLGEAGGALVGGVRRVEAVDDGVDHHRLLRDGEGAVRWHCDPVICGVSVERTVADMKYAPRSKVSGSLATRTMSEPLSRRSIT